MKRWMTSLFLVVLAVASASAHFIWIVPDKAAEGKATARVIFSEDLQPDKPDYLAKIAQTELFARGADGKTVPVKWTRGADFYQAAPPGAGARVLAGVCRYGVLQRGESEPFLLMYYPKALLNAAPAAPGFHDACDRLLLEILPVKDEARTFRVLWRGKPLADAEVVILAPGTDKRIKKKTGKNGSFQLDLAAKGAYGLHVRHVETSAERLHGGLMRGWRAFVHQSGRWQTLSAVGEGRRLAGSRSTGATAHCPSHGRGGRRTTDCARRRLEAGQHRTH